MPLYARNGIIFEKFCCAMHILEDLEPLKIKVHADLFAYAFYFQVLAVLYFLPMV